MWQVGDSAIGVAQTGSFGLGTAAAFAPAIGFGMPALKNLGGSNPAKQVAGGPLKHVNPSKSNSNCVNCALATDATLAGRAASALPGRPISPNKLITDGYFDGKFVRVSGIEDIRKRMERAGSGSRGIVLGVRDPGINHVFNVINERGVVNFLDVQTDSVANTADNFVSFMLLITSK